MPNRRIAFLAYETPFAPCGGIASVMKLLPGQIRRVSGDEVCVITPFHHLIERTKSIEPRMKKTGDFNISFRGVPIRTALLKFEDEVPYYFIKPLDDTFFTGNPNPYLVGETPAEISESLLRDSLFFGRAVAEALKVIDAVSGWTLMMQDWETAGAALAFSGESERPRMFITLHNSYDSRATDSDLHAAGIDPLSCPAYYPQPFLKTETVLARALQIVGSPIFTVSEQFASDLTSERLHTEITAPHLQGLLRGRLLGINNGLFAERALEDSILDKARRRDFRALRKWKNGRRNNAVQSLRTMKPSHAEPLWGDIGKFDHGGDSTCWFVMAGRDDPRQKGYDVAVSAARDFILAGGDARFFFFPVPGDEGREGLRFLKDLAEAFPDKVLAFPFMWKEGFSTVLQGSSYGVMPSFYEPFGMANEFYLSGTVGIGRATGGIVQQIIPLRAASAFSSAAERLSIRWHSESARPTGILFREEDAASSASADWRAINAETRRSGRYADRVSERSRIALFASMAQELAAAFSDGARIYRQNPDLYCGMLVDGIDYISNTFSWERAAQEYCRNIR